MTWKRYQVHVHEYGRRLITRDGPCQGLLEWPQHQWCIISPRPLGLKAAIALAQTQTTHAVVTLYMDAEMVHDNCKVPIVPTGWYPPDAQIAAGQQPHSA